MIFTYLFELRGALQSQKIDQTPRQKLRGPTVIEQFLSGFELPLDVKPLFPFEKAVVCKKESQFRVARWIQRLPQIN